MSGSRRIHWQSRPADLARHLCVVLALFLAIALLAPAPAAAKYASLVMDAETGEILHEINADTRNYPASLTKMMTLYLVFEALDQGKLTLGQRLVASRHAERQPPSQLGLRKGDRLTVEQAILALVTKSANDAAVVLAEALGGTERQFALIMTAKARKLGMERTTFRNASGLPNRGQLSTAHDMAVLARHLFYDFPQYYHYFATPSFRWRDRTYSNHNKLLRTYDGVDGIKTGYIRASGFNLVTSAERNGRRIIGVVFGGKTSGARNRHMASLLNKGFRLLQAGGETRTAEAGEWGIQVGAFYETGPAYAMAKKAVATLPSLLGDGMVKVVPLQKRRSTLYRSRILGITKKQAYRACRLLKRAEMGCLELRVPDGVQMAQAGR